MTAPPGIAAAPSAYGLRLRDDARHTTTARSTKHNNRREVEPLQASTMGPPQMSGPNIHSNDRSAGFLGADQGVEG